mgnify:CR=1 FL=1
MNISIIGYGSQGKRIHSLIKKKFNKVYIFHPRKKNKIFNNNIKILKESDIVFICSPNYSHLKYINILNNETYIFCEKPPVNKLSQYIKLKKIISKKKIYFNFNERFDLAPKFINKNKKILGKFLYGNFEIGYNINKKILKNSWKGNKTKTPRGVFEILSIHYLDLVNYLFGIKKLENKFYKNNNGVVTSAISKILTKENSDVNIFCSFSSPFVFKKKMIFENGIVESDEKSFKVYISNKNSKNIKKTSLLKLIKNNKHDYYKRYSNSVKDSVNFFLDDLVLKKKSAKINNQISLKSTKFFLNKSNN